VPSPNKLSLHQLYDCKCPTCGGNNIHRSATDVNIERLSLSQTESDDLQKAFNKAARWIFKQKKSEIQPDDLNDQAVQPLLNSINSVLQDGFNKGTEHRVPYIMKRDLRENIYVFSGAKTYAELKELSGLLLDGDGNIKPFYKFWQEVQSIHADYNKSYLEAEYIFATQSAQMASKWNEFEADGDRYNLQYRTAYDDRVRDSHRLLHDITLPPSDPFWNDYFPPNGWRCRCTAVQVRKNKYPESDSQQAVKLGSDATNGKNNIFRFNPGKQQVIFPEHHPYLKNLNKPEKEIIKKKAQEADRVLTKDDVVSVISEIDKEKNWFERGFSKLEATRKAGVNGSTDMDGKIWLKPDRMEKVISAIDKLNRNEKIGAGEADSLATFWHEVTHNRSKPGNMRMTDLQTRYMELANEFVARKTLPEFYEAFGSKVQYPQLMQHRKTTGYNQMVRNYQNIINKTGLDNDLVVEKVKDHLFNKPYDRQKMGLTNALDGAVKKDGTKLTKAEINAIVSQAERKNMQDFDKYLDGLIR
jgi:SPP1 gp7 family putative phage head morphogenesis protein